jgi:hypothetical protein
MQNQPGRVRIILITGDIITLGLVTIFGFASHGTAGTAGVRMLSTFVPLIISWFLVAPFLKVYDPESAASWREIWRPFWSMVISGPMAAWLRGMILGTPILPLFVIILGGVSAIGILLWRCLYIIIIVREKSQNG